MERKNITSLFIFLLLLILAGNSAFAQQDAQFSHYMFNKLYFNPSAAGLDEDRIEFQLFHRSQWLGYSNTMSLDSAKGTAPDTQVFTFNLPLSKFRSGIGIHLVNDVRGPLQTVEAQFSYAYHVKMKKGRKLSFGVRGGLYNFSINYDWLRYNDLNDPLIQSLQGAGRQSAPDFAAGMYYNSPKVFLGVGVNHLSQSDFAAGGFQVNRLKPHANVVLGYNMDVNTSVVFTPSVFVKTDLNTYALEANAMLTFNEKVWGALAYRESEAAILMFGANLLRDKSLSLGYAFEYTTNGREAKQPTSHELMLTYRIPGPKWLIPHPVRTPRFRHAD